MPHDIETFRKRVESFIVHTESARINSERARDYVNNAQWTDTEAAKLRDRQQAPIVINRVHPKLEGLKGLLIQRKTDPKAFPRTKAHEESAHAVTDALRFVADNTRFDEIKLAVADNFFVEGYAGAIVDIKSKGKETEIEIDFLPFDRIYFDPHSRRHDFKDATYMGMVPWMYVEQARSIFGPIVDDIVAHQSSEFDTETFSDRPEWMIGEKSNRRIRIALDFSLIDDVWHVAAFSGNTFLRDPEPSPYVDEEGEPTNPIELVSAHIARVGNRRFGEVEYWLDLQDEINHRRSKALHLLSSRQTSGRKGAVKDIPAMKREMAKPDGHVEYEGERGDWERLDTSDMASGQFSLLEHSTAELDAVSFNAQLSGERQGNLSGKAILALQSAGTTEIAPLFNQLNGWEKRIYTQIWWRIKDHWNEQKWIRVTDDRKALRWVGFNTPMTLQALIEEKIEDESLDDATRAELAEEFQAMVESQDPRLQAVQEIRNPVAELDMDIILEQSLDTVNIAQEQFEILATLAGNRPEVPFATLLELSTLRDKDGLIEEIRRGEASRADLVQAQAEAEVAKETAKIEAELKKDGLLAQQQIESTEKIKAAELEFEREKAGIDKDRAVHEATLNRDHPKRLDIPDADSIVSSMDNLAASNRESATTSLAIAEQNAVEVSELVEILNRPRSVERDGDGKVIGLV